MKEVTDSTPFPFGKYKNKPMQLVPAEYLIWCLENINNLEHSIKKYITDNMQGLQQEMKKHRH
jgi:uncharacterized protein (DUF3820 family)